MVNINLKFQKKDLWLLSAIVVFLVGVGFVVAYGGNDPAVMGHSYQELQKCGANLILKTNPSGQWECVAESGGGSFVPSTYNGEESVTFPNGLIIKSGQVTLSRTVDYALIFASAFPHGIISIVFSRSVASPDQNWSWTVKSRTKTGATFWTSSDSGTYDWIAIGY